MTQFLESPESLVKNREIKIKKSIVVRDPLNIDILETEKSMKDKALK